LERVPGRGVSHSSIAMRRGREVILTKNQMDMS
jgi:hypothetical protein